MDSRSLVGLSGWVRSVRAESPVGWLFPLRLCTLLVLKAAIVVLAASGDDERAV